VSSGVRVSAATRGEVTYAATIESKAHASCEQTGRCADQD